MSSKGVFSNQLGIHAFQHRYTPKPVMFLNLKNAHLLPEEKNQKAAFDFVRVISERIFDDLCCNVEDGAGLQFLLDCTLAVIKHASPSSDDTYLQNVIRFEAVARDISQQYYSLSSIAGSESNVESYKAAMKEKGQLWGRLAHMTNTLLIDLRHSTFATVDAPSTSKWILKCKRVSFFCGLLCGWMIVFKMLLYLSR